MTGIAADLGVRDGVDTLTSSVPQTDILVNNLGMFEPKPFTDSEAALNIPVEMIHYGVTKTAQVALA